MGKIILLNTPIGNLGDLTPRVLEALKTGSTFAVEDTRVFKDLLNHLGISLAGKKVIAFHDQSEDTQVDRLLDLTAECDLYVTSDAGSPVISDPAYPLVKRAVERGIPLESYSGVSSPVMALELSGLPPIPFHFQGFLPRETAKKIKAFSELSGGTHIFFDAPTRVEETLEALAEILPDARVAVVRELSKKFEQVLRFKASDWKEKKSELVIKGEFVLLVHQTQSKQTSSSELVELAHEMLEKGAGPRPLSKLLSLILDKPAKDLYQQIIRR